MEVLETVGQGVKGVDMIYTCQSPEFCFRANRPCRSKTQPHHAFLASSRPSRRTQTCQPSRTTPSKQHQNQIQSATPLEMELFNFNIPISLPITMRFRRAGALSTLAATPPPSPRLQISRHERTTDPFKPHRPHTQPRTKTSTPQQDAYPVSGGTPQEKVSGGEAC